MPIYEFICQDCAHRFETLVGRTEEAACPTCQSKKLDKQFSVFGVGRSSEGAAPAMPGACGTCGDPRGPGSCAN